MDMRPSGNLPTCSHKSTGPTSGGPATEVLEGLASTSENSLEFSPRDVDSNFYCNFMGLTKAYSLIFTMCHL